MSNEEILPTSGAHLEELVSDLLTALEREFSDDISTKYQFRIQLQSGETVVPDFSLRVSLPHEESWYLIECQHRKKTSATILHKIQHARSKSKFKTFIFIYGTRITRARRRSFEAEGIMVYSFSEFAHSFVGYLRDTLAGLDESKMPGQDSALTKMLSRIPHHQAGDYSRRSRPFSGTNQRDLKRGFPANRQEVNRLLAHKHFEDIGGCAIPERLGEYGQDVITNEQAYNAFLSELGYYFGPGIEVQFSYVMNLSISGFADRSSEGTYFIGIGLGSLIRFSHAFAYLLAIPDVLPGLGEASKENGAPFNLRAVLSGSFQAAANMAIRDPERGKAAKVMEMFVSDLLFTHELAHVLDGHVDYSAAGGHSRLSESGDTSIWTDLETLRAMEDLADRQATLMVCDFPGRGLMNRSTVCYKILQEFDPLTVWKLWSFALVILYYSLRESRSNPEVICDDIHRHPEFRVVSIIRYARQIVSERHTKADYVACHVGTEAGVRDAARALQLGGIRDAMRNWFESQEDVTQKVGKVAQSLESDQFAELRAHSFWKYFRFPR